MHTRFTSTYVVKKKFFSRLSRERERVDVDGKCPTKKKRKKERERMSVEFCGAGWMSLPAAVTALVMACLQQADYAHVAQSSRSNRNAAKLRSACPVTVTLSADSTATDARYALDLRPRHLVCVKPSIDVLNLVSKDVRLREWSIKDTGLLNHYDFDGSRIINVSCCAMSSLVKVNLSERLGACTIFIVNDLPPTLTDLTIYYQYITYTATELQSVNAHLQKLQISCRKVPEYYVMGPRGVMSGVAAFHTLRELAISPDIGFAYLEYMGDELHMLRTITLGRVVLSDRLNQWAPEDEKTLPDHQAPKGKINRKDTWFPVLENATLRVDCAEALAAFKDAVLLTSLNLSHSTLQHQDWKTSSVCMPPHLTHLVLDKSQISTAFLNALFRNRSIQKTLQTFEALPVFPNCYTTEPTHLFYALLWRTTKLKTFRAPHIELLTGSEIDDQVNIAQTTLVDLFVHAPRNEPPNEALGNAASVSSAKLVTTFPAATLEFCRPHETFVYYTGFTAVRPPVC
jgi:hypothetical protein